MNIGLAVLTKPEDYTGVANSNQHKTGQLKNLGSELNRYFQGINRQDPRKIFIQKALIDASCFHPSCIELDDGGEVEVLKKPATGGFPEYIHQILSDDIFTQIDLLVAPESGFRIRTWQRTWATLNKVSGFYDSTGIATFTPISDITFKRPTGSTGNNTLLYIKKETTGVSGSNITTKEFVQTLDGAGKPTSVVQKIYEGEGTGGTLLSQEDVTFSERGSKLWDYSIVRERKEASLNGQTGAVGALVLVSKTKENYDDFSLSAAGGELGMKRLVQQTEAFSVAGQSPQTTTYVYENTPANSLTHGRLQSVAYPDGRWKYHSYTMSETSNTSVIMDYESYNNVTMANRESARKTVTTTTGTTITKQVYLSGSMIEQEVQTMTTESGKKVIKTDRGIADVLTSSVAYHEDGSNIQSGRIAWAEHEDGTATTYSYAGTGAYTVTMRQGAGNRNGVTAGTQVVTSYNQSNIAIGETTTDIASGVVIDEWITDNTHTPAFDQMLRPVKKKYFGNANDYTIAKYACCGLEEERDRSGATTKYFRDKLRRVYKVETQVSAASPVIASLTSYNGLSRTSEQRIGATVRFLGSQSTSLDGLTRTQTSPARKSANVADRIDTTTVITRSTTGEGDTETTTYEDGSNKIVKNFCDGRTKSISGTAVSNSSTTFVSYSYTIGGYGGELITETRTCSTGNLISRSYYDSLGRVAYATSSQAGSQNYFYYSAASAAGSRGKLNYSRDGDAVLTYYSYNNKGEPLEVTRNVPAVNASGVNVTARVGTRAVVDYVASFTVHGTAIGASRRTTNTAISNNGTASTADDIALITSTNYSSIDGHIQASITPQGDSLSITTDPDANGVATTTSINADSTKSVSTTTHGLLTKVENKASDGTVITETTYSYNAGDQRLESVTDSRTGTVTYSNFTESLEPLTTTDAANNPTTQARDIMGRVISLTLPDTTVKYTSYYPTGQVKAEWGSQTNPTFRIYNQQNQLIELRTYKNKTDEPAISDNVSTFAKTNWNYSNKGLLASKRDHSGKGPDYTYTAAGRLRTVAQARTLPGVATTRITKTINYGAGMQTSITYNVGGTPNVTTTYDVLGRVKTITQTNQSQLEYTYTGLDLDTETIRYDGNNDGSYTSDNRDLVRTLDRRNLSVGRDKGWELKNGSTVENQVTYDYDTAGRFWKVDNSVDVFTYGYNYSQTYSTPLVTTPPTPPVPNGPRIGDTNGSYQDYMPYTITKSGTPSLQSIRTFEINRDVLAKIENKAGTDIRSGYTYNEVNAIGQRKKVTAAYNLGSGITHNAGETNWSYDDGLGHLTKADAPGTIADRSFEYDHIGNRKKSALGLDLTASTGVSNYDSNDLNQYTAVDSFIPSYDDDGNQTDAQIKPITATTAMSSLFAWDGINQLAEVKDDTNTSRVKYRYDALNRRIARILPDESITHYVYDGWNCIAEYSASSSAAASLARKRTWGLDLSGQSQGAGGGGGLLCETHGSTPYYPTYDGNGNVSEYLNADGSTAAHFEYDAFGRTILPTTANDSNQFTYRFSTKPVEPLTGLYYYGYRWYDPMTGRWPSRDPIEEEGGLNLYGFVGNDGVNALDLLGLYSLFSSRTNILGDGTPNPQPWPDLEFEGMECHEQPAKLKKLNLEVIMPDANTGWTSHVPVELWVDWEIEGVYIGPRWTYGTCFRYAPQPFADYPMWNNPIHPGVWEKPAGHIPGCDDGNCKFNACDPQLTQLVFHFLSCECEIDSASFEYTGRKIWTRKVYVDEVTINGDQAITGAWSWRITNH
jgi:RHS repeat-associated protein